ncbi:MAG: hypothetical protein AVDCRST_MAG13-708, partial [uncultured Solirubrobacteraceae bacterium]
PSRSGCGAIPTRRSPAGSRRRPSALRGSSAASSTSRSGA